MDLEIRNLHVSAEDKEIVKGVNLRVRNGEFHVIMGPNGSGKSTLARAIMGHPKLRITSGDILVDEKSVLKLTPDRRAKLGLFLQFQTPVEVEGVGFVNFLHSAKRSVAQHDIDVNQFMKEITDLTKSLALPSGVVGRSLNYGFSGGEKKKAEIVQLAVLKPKLAILDEPDSGLDIDAIRTVATNINRLVNENGMGLIVITHYSRILNYMKPRYVHVMVNGRIVADGSKELIDRLEKEGYDSFVKK